MRALFAVAILALLIMPVAMAAEENEESVLTPFKTQIEIFNMIASIVVFVMSLIAYFSMDANTKKGWIFISVATLMFAVYELLGGLAEFGVQTVPGLREVTEILFLVLMAIGVLKFMMRPTSYQ